MLKVETACIFSYQHLVDMTTDQKLGGCLRFTPVNCSGVKHMACGLDPAPSAGPESDQVHMGHSVCL